jgi:L-iditol 2-dehydrogenase
MKAAFLMGVRQVDVRDVPDPVVPEDGIVVQVKACGLCGSDLRRWKEGPPPSAEILPGHEIGGVVAAVGPKVTGYVVGDHLAVAPDVHCGACYYCQRGQYNLCDDLRFLGTTPGYRGGFAEYCLLSGEVLANGVVHHMAAGQSFVQGALAEPCSSVLAAHDKAGTGLGDTVLVMGGGPIGCLHIQVARARGARVILSEPNKGRREIAGRFGAELLLDPMKDDVVAAVRQATGGLGVDTVVCANPVAATQTQAVEAVRKAGRVILFGGLPKASPMASVDANRIHYGEIVVVGAFSYHHTYHALALDLLRRGMISTEVVTHFFSLAEVDAAFAAADSQSDALKVMIMF